jgi:hypothetical protein
MALMSVRPLSEGESQRVLRYLEDKSAARPAAPD